jgi:hypothetical protein
LPGPVKAASARGRKAVLFGRPSKLTPHQRREAIARCNAGETLMDIARSYNVSHSTISRLSCLEGKRGTLDHLRSGGRDAEDLLAGRGHAGTLHDGLE